MTEKTTFPPTPPFNNDISALCKPSVSFLYVGDLGILIHVKESISPNLKLQVACPGNQKTSHTFKEHSGFNLYICSCLQNHIDALITGTMGASRNENEWCQNTATKTKAIRLQRVQGNASTPQHREWSNSNEGSKAPRKNSNRSTVQFHTFSNFFQNVSKLLEPTLYVYGPSTSPLPCRNSQGTGSTNQRHVLKPSHIRRPAESRCRSPTYQEPFGNPKRELKQKEIPYIDA